MLEREAQDLTMRWRQQALADDVKKIVNKEKDAKENGRKKKDTKEKDAKKAQKKKYAKEKRHKKKKRGMMTFFLFFHESRKRPRKGS